MAVDARGLSLTGSAAAVIAYDRAIDHLIRFQAEVVDAAAAAVAADPGCALASLLCAYLALMSTEESAVAGARDALAQRAGRARADLLPRERAHLAAAERWVAGDMTGAGELLSEISVEYPRDLLALAVGHQIDFFTGSAVNLRDRIGRALGGWHADDRQVGFVHGMYAFGLEECNLYRQSEEIGQAAVEHNPDDVWGIHAVVHTYEMAGRIPDGVRFMRSREADWMAGNFLNVHNSWHYALYLLQGGDTGGALAVYDRTLHHEGSEDVALELLDASALLWRMQLEGTDVGDRWRRSRRPGAACSHRASTRSTTCTPSWPSSATASLTGPRMSSGTWKRWSRRADLAAHRPADDRRGRPAGLPQPGPLRPGRVRQRHHRPDADPDPAQ